MPETLVALAVLAFVAGALFALPWVLPKARRAIGRDATAGILGIVDELYRPAVHSAAVVAEQRQELPAPAPLAGDKP